MPYPERFCLYRQTPRRTTICPVPLLDSLARPKRILRDG
uniref:Uncharacterized protein n=1 Tax=Anguilla anguilla TaxID=7936 RepID=A0A0E9UFC6_ANGAN